MTDAPHDEKDLHILHALRCIGTSTEARVTAASGIPAASTSRGLNQLSERGLVVLDPGPFGGWSLTDAGRSADDESLRRELDAMDARTAIRRHYEEFLGMNPTVLQVCSDWQMQTIGNTPVLNDHADVEYDRQVLGRLVRIDAAAQALVGSLADAVARFSVYQGRFSLAIDQVMAGNHEFVSDGLHSYHSVWFQLHEDLLTTLGISRDEERQSRG